MEALLAALLRKRQHLEDGECGECAPSVDMHDTEEAGPQLTGLDGRQLTAVEAALDVIAKHELPPLKKTGCTLDSANKRCVMKHQRNKKECRAIFPWSTHGKLEAIKEALLLKYEHLLGTKCCQ